MKYNNSYLLKYMNYILPFNKLFLSLGGSGSRVIKNLETLKSVHWDELKKITIDKPSKISSIYYEIPVNNPVVDGEQATPVPAMVNVLIVKPRKNSSLPGEVAGGNKIIGYEYEVYDINGDLTYWEYIPIADTNESLTSINLIEAINVALESHLPNIKKYGINIAPVMNPTYEFTKDQEVYPSIIFKDIKDSATFDWSKLLSVELTVTENTQGIITMYVPGQEPTIAELKQNYTLYNEQQDFSMSYSKEELYEHLYDLFFSLKNDPGVYITISGSLANCIKLYLDDEEGTKTTPYNLFINTKNHNWETVAAVILKENTIVQYSGECFGVSIETGTIKGGFAYYDGTLYEYDEFNENFSNGALDFILNECDYDDELIQASVPAELRDYIQIVLK